MKRVTWYFSLFFVFAILLEAKIYLIIFKFKWNKQIKIAFYENPHALIIIIAI